MKCRLAPSLRLSDSGAVDSRLGKSKVMDKGAEPVKEGVEANHWRKIQTWLLVSFSIENIFIPDVVCI